MQKMQDLHKSCRERAASAGACDAGLTVPFIIKWARDSSSEAEPKQPPTLQEVRVRQPVGNVGPHLHHFASRTAPKPFALHHPCPACNSSPVMPHLGLRSEPMGFLLQMIATIKEKNSQSTA
jgi:hypothetical protein